MEQEVKEKLERVEISAYNLYNIALAAAIHYHKLKESDIDEHSKEIHTQIRDAADLLALYAEAVQINTGSDYTRVCFEIPQ